MYGGLDEKHQKILWAVIVIVLLVILGLVSMRVFLYAKFGKGSLASFGFGAGATIFPGLSKHSESFHHLKKVKDIRK